MRRGARAAGRVIVVGGGLFGSATARYLAEAGRPTTIITSPEPPDGDVDGSITTDGAWVDGRPRASHYDQGRIVRRGGSNSFMSAARTLTMDRLPDLAARSGVPFFTPRPLVTLTSDPETDVVVSRTHGADVDIWPLDAVADRYGIAAPDGFGGRAVVESAQTAGFVNPRLLIDAQLGLAAAAGCTIVDSPARQVTIDNAAGLAVVETFDGRSVVGERLVLATGAYGASLLGLDLEIQRRLRTVALIEVGRAGNDPAGEDPAGEDPAGKDPADELPSLSASDFRHPNRGRAKVEETYWVPPIRYPDGGTYLKIGGNSLPMITAAVDDDISRWFAGGGSSEEAEALFALALDLLPQHSLRLAGFKPCVVSYTADERPILKQVGERVVVAVAGNGSGAAISDEMGRRAADMITTV